MEKLKRLLMTAILSESFAGWSVDLDDGYWVARVSQRPQILQLAWIGWRVIAPLITVIAINKLQDYYERRRRGKAH